MHDLGEARQRGGAERLDLALHACELITGRLDQAAVGGIGNGLQQDQVAEPFEEIDREASWVVPRVDDLLDGPEQSRAVGRRQRVDGGVDECDVGDAEQCECALVGDALVVGAGEELIEDRQRVTRRTTTGTDDQRVDLGRDGHALPLTDLLQQPAHDRRGEQTERVVVRTRTDRRQHLLGFGRREHEDQVLRRLLHDLEQRVEAGVGHHVRLVDDEHAITRLGRRIERAVAQLAGVVDAAMAGCVEFDDVEVAGTAGSESHARRAGATGTRGGALDTVQRPRQDSRRRRLATPARTGEQVRVVDAPRVEGTAQRIGDVLLPHDVGEGSRAIGAIQSHASRVPATRDIGCACLTLRATPPSRVLHPSTHRRFRPGHRPCRRTRSPARRRLVPTVRRPADSRPRPARRPVRRRR